MSAGLNCRHFPAELVGNCVAIDSGLRKMSQLSTGQIPENFCCPRESARERDWLPASTAFHEPSSDCPFRSQDQRVENRVWPSSIARPCERTAGQLLRWDSMVDFLVSAETWPAHKIFQSLCPVQIGSEQATPVGIEAILGLRSIRFTSACPHSKSPASGERCLPFPLQPAAGE